MPERAPWVARRVQNVAGSSRPSMWERLAREPALIPYALLFGLGGVTTLGEAITPAFPLIAMETIFIALMASWLAALVIALCVFFHHAPDQKPIMGGALARHYRAFAQIITTFAMAGFSAFVGASASTAASESIGGIFEAVKVPVLIAAFVCAVARVGAVCFDLSRRTKEDRLAACQRAATALAPSLGCRHRIYLNWLTKVSHPVGGALTAFVGVWASAVFLGVIFHA